MYHATAYVGLDKDFMVKAHLLVPEGYENNLYSWLLNFKLLMMSILKCIMNQ